MVSELAVDGSTSIPSDFESIRKGPSLASRFFWKIFKAPGRTTSVTVYEKVPIPMRDGVTLLADIYVPANTGPTRTLFMQSPYPRSGLYAMEADFLAARGYTVLFVSCRGRNGSGGEFTAMSGHGRDAADVVTWLRNEPWFNDRFVSIGSSYAGYTQWAFVDEVIPPELIGMIVGCGPHDFAENAVGSGPYRVFDYLGWSRTVNIGMSGRRGFEKRANDFLLANKRGVPPELREFAPWTMEWAEHPDVEDSYWADYRHGSALDKVDVPVFLTNGWFDIFLEQTLEQWHRLGQRQVPVTARIGPFGHLGPIGSNIGPYMQAMLDWLDDLFESGRGALSRTHSSRIQYGRGNWAEFASWPPNDQTRSLFLAPDGALLDSFSTRSTTCSITTRLDDPTPAVGGGWLAQGKGAKRDNRKLEARSDVLTFTTAPLTEDLWVAGNPVAEVWLQTDAPSFDLFAAITEVDRKGRSWNVTDAIVRWNSGDESGDGPIRILVPLVGVAHKFPKGHRLRLQISGGAFPRFDHNPQLISAGSISLRIEINGGSHLVLPITGPATDRE